MRQTVLSITRVMSILYVLFYGLSAHGNTERPLYIIFDGSNSMWGELQDKTRKIQAARQVFDDLDDDLFEDRPVALRVYGHRREKDCEDTELLVPFSKGQTTRAKLASVIDSLSPLGRTPITRSLQAALADFDGKAGDILLISDGVETCDADPCQLVSSWQDNNIDIRVHVVGLGLTADAQAAMQCIAAVSGTRYQEASTTQELNQALVQYAEAEPLTNDDKLLEQKPLLEFRIVAKDDSGRPLPAAGQLFDSDGYGYAISSDNRYVFAAGDYTATIGVPTANGVLYGETSKALSIADSGETLFEIVLPRPPAVKTRFMENGNEVPGVIATAYLNDTAVMRLRPYEDYFVMPGLYDFHADLNVDNPDLRVSLEIEPQAEQTIDFALISTVKTTFKVIDGISRTPLRQHQELWQNGELKYKLHYVNGADVQPGTYTLKSPAYLTPFVLDNVQVPQENNQVLELIAPMGEVALSYNFQREPGTSDRRCWLQRVDPDASVTARRSKSLSCNGEPITLAQGRYRVRPWSKLGTFKETVFSVKTGERSDVFIPQIDAP